MWWESSPPGSSFSLVICSNARLSLPSLSRNLFGSILCKNTRTESVDCLVPWTLRSIRSSASGSYQYLGSRSSVAKNRPNARVRSLFGCRLDVRSLYAWIRLAALVISLSFRMVRLPWYTYSRLSLSFPKLHYLVRSVNPTNSFPRE